jgi:nucleoside-diphosphate-sugar epimerase
VNELGRTLANIAGSDVPFEYSPARPGELRHSSLDTTRLQSLGWKPEQRLAEGLRVTYEWIRAAEE